MSEEETPAEAGEAPAAEQRMEEEEEEGKEAERVETREGKKEEEVMGKEAGEEEEKEEAGEGEGEEDDDLFGSDDEEADQGEGQGGGDEGEEGGGGEVKAEAEEEEAADAVLRDSDSDSGSDSERNREKKREAAADSDASDTGAAPAAAAAAAAEAEEVAPPVSRKLYLHVPDLLRAGMAGAAADGAGEESKMGNVEGVLPAAGEVYTTKLPSLLGVATMPFDKESFSEEAAQQESSSTIRWRWADGAAAEAVDDGDDDPTGNALLTRAKESNARLVTWSDGSMTLHVGAEHFDVSRTDMQNLFVFANLASHVDREAIKRRRQAEKQKARERREKQKEQAQGGAQETEAEAEAEEDDDDDDEEDEETLEGETCLELQAAVTQRLTFKPTSLQSRSHKMHALNVLQRQSKRAGTQLLTNLVDNPEREQEERAARAERGAKKRRKERSRVQSSSGMTADFMEAGSHVQERHPDYQEEGEYEDDDIEGASISLLKQRVRGGGGGSRKRRR